MFDPAPELQCSQWHAHKRHTWLARTALDTFKARECPGMESDNPARADDIPTDPYPAPVNKKTLRSESQGVSTLAVAPVLDRDTLNFIVAQARQVESSFSSYDSDVIDYKIAAAFGQFAINLENLA